ncbi:MAG: ComEC/Rec2 family competence protein [Kineosporiaceae bacterium]|nr:ComEC/Rec2 family competence protein [Aeromicrobium sp.]
MAPPSLCAWTMAAIAVSTNATVACGLAVLGVGLAGLATMPKRSKFLTIALISAVAMAGVCAIAAWRLTTIAHSPVHALGEKGQLATIEAVVRGDAHTFSAHGSTQVVVDVTVRRVEARDGSFSDRAPVTVFAEGAAAKLQVGERLTMIGRFSPSDASDTAAEFNALRLGPAHQEAWWWAASSSMRAAVTEAVSHTGPEPSALIPALVHGDDHNLSESVKDDFRRSGLTHLLAVSGTNLTIVLVTILLVGRAAGVRRRGQWILGAFAVAGFVILARPDPSVLRAAAMGSVGLAALGYGSRGGVRALSWAVIVLMVIDPWLSKSVGFILSVCATAGILLLAPRFAEVLGRHMPEWCAIAIAVPIAAQLACTPVIAAISGQVSIVAILANIAAGPVVAPATVTGLLGGAVALASLPTSHLVGAFAGLCARWILFVGHWCASLPGASTQWSGSLWLLGGLCVAATFAFIWIGARPALFWGLGLGLAFCMWRPPAPGWPPEGWVMVACDIGQGDATVLNAGDGSAVVIDSGPAPASVDACLRRLRIDHVRLMVFTHGHADHIGGWAGVSRNRRVDQIMVGPTGGPGGNGIPRHAALLGERFAVGALQFEVLGPMETPSFRADVGPAANNASVVLDLTTRGVRILLAGDIEPEAQQALLRNYPEVHADVLKMPHHGSANQSEELFAGLGVRVATISDGMGNDYGHPSPTALALLKLHHIATYRTDQQGDIAIVVQDNRITVLTR